MRVRLSRAMARWFCGLRLLRAIASRPSRSDEMVAEERVAERKARVDTDVRQVAMSTRWRTSRR
jgi:hypothetical protein